MQLISVILITFFTTFGREGLVHVEFLEEEEEDNPTPKLISTDEKKKKFRILKFWVKPFCC